MSFQLEGYLPINPSSEGKQTVDMRDVYETLLSACVSALIDNKILNPTNITILGLALEKTLIPELIDELAAKIIALRN